MSVVFLFISISISAHLAYADFGPNSSTGEGDPNCSCVNPDAQGVAQNQIECFTGVVTRSGKQYSIKGACTTADYCTMINNIPNCVSKITGCREDNPSVCAAKKPTTGGRHPITQNDCWCTYPVDQQKNSISVGGNLQGVNGRTCTDGVDTYKDYNQLGCGINEMCVDSTTNPKPTVIDPTDKNPQTNKHTVGVCQPLSCNCDNLNTPGPGKNGMTCKNPYGTTSDVFPCSDLQVCTQAKANDGNASCQQMKNCTCENPDTPGSGKNGFDCKLPDGTIYGPGYCDDPNEACENNPDTTVTCKNEASKLNSTSPTVEPTLPPPPPPPCASKIMWGNCASFDTELSALGIGALSTDPAQFITTLIGIFLSISGGIAVFLIIIAGYRIMTSQGKPEALNQAREQLMAAIVGLLFLIFSFVILQVITVDLLQIPGFK